MVKIILRVCLLVYLLLFFVLSLYPIYTSGFTAQSFFWSIAIMAIYLLLADLIFRLSYRLYYQHPYQMVPKVPFSKIYVEPHPYMPFVYKARAITQKRQIALYPLHHGEYWFPQTQSNNYRYFNGPGGDRDIVTPKPPGLIRINCLGASTTGNDLEYNGVIYSYPLELERILHKKFPGISLEVNNCGVGGRTTAEILIDFLLSSIDTSPDIIILYQAYNDLQPSLTPGFSSDYSHAKRGLGESYHLYRRYSKFPALPLALYNMFMNKLLLSNIRHSLHHVISKGEVDLNSDFQGLSTYQRNIEHVINICKSNHIHLICSTFCYYLYEEVKNSPIHQKYFSGVLEENSAIRELCRKHDIPLVDNFNLMPREEKYFVDTIHFSPDGMTRLAEHISQSVISYLESKVNRD